MIDKIDTDLALELGIAEFIDMARHYGIAVITAGDSEYPQIADVTGPFVYARLMGAQAKEPLGYSAVELDAWAERARTWAKGDAPADLKTVAPDKGGHAERDVFLYFISGHKVLNPAAARALIARLN